MNIPYENIAIKYQTAKEYCSCCNREFDVPEFGEVREFDVTLKSFFEWADWSVISEIDEEDIEETVQEYLFDTIGFHAIRSNEILKICEGEKSKIITLVLAFVKEN